MIKKIFLIGLVCLLFIHCNKSSPTSPSTPEPTPQKPTISSFAASSSTIKRGASCTLSWSVSNATTVSIDQGIGNVSASGSQGINPTSTITYTLTATNSVGAVTKECKVEVENGADIVMISGPIYKDPWLYTDAYFSYFGKAKNQGTYKASFVKVYIYLNDSGGNMVDYDYTYVDKTDLEPGEESPWEVVWSDSNKAIRNKMDKSKTTYEFEWSEYDWIYRTGEISIWR